MNIYPCGVHRDPPVLLPNVCFCLGTVLHVSVYGKRSSIHCVMYNNRTLLTAACRMSLHGNYLCIPNGLTLPVFSNHGEALGPRITTRLLETRLKTCENICALIFLGSQLCGGLKGVVYNYSSVLSI